MSAAYVLHAGFRETEMQNLSLADQLLDRAGNLFHRHVMVDPVLIEQVNPVSLQALQRSFQRSANTLRRAVHRAAAFDVETKLGGDNDTVAYRLKRFTNHLFVFV